MKAESFDVIEEGVGYQLVRNNWGAGLVGICCRTCNRISYNPPDIARKYCGNCHKFHEDVHMEGREVAKERRPLGALGLKNVASGTMYSTGTMVALMLAVEDPRDRVEVLVDVMKEFGIPLLELVDLYNAVTCPTCGCRTSPLQPCECVAGAL